MRDYIRINYEKLSTYSINLGRMIQSFEDCKTALAKAGEALLPAHGEAVMELENRRLMTIDTIDGAIGRMEETRQAIIGYKTEMKGLVPAISDYVDMQINKVDYEEFIKTVKDQLENGFDPAPISPTYDKYYLPSIIDENGIAHSVEDWDRYSVEEANGRLVEGLRNSQRQSAYNKTQEKLLEIENEYSEYIVPFFEADSEWAVKLSQMGGFMTSETFEKQLEEWNAEYEKLMPGGIPNWDYLQEIMQMNPEDVTIAQLQGISRMYDYFQRIIDAGPEIYDKNTLKWADAKLSKFYKMCYVNGGVTFYQGHLYPDAPHLSLLLQRIGLGEQAYPQSNIPNIFTIFGDGPMYIAWWVTMDRLSKGQSMLGFYPDMQQGIFYTKPDTWQKHLGYSHFYDFFFAIGTFGQMDRARLDVTVPIEYDGEIGYIDVAFWLWKGNYLNLGAGAESGSYYGFSNFLTRLFPGVADMRAGYYARDAHYTNKDGEIVGDNIGMYKMTLVLKDKEGNEIFRREPDGQEWWITGFKPSFQNPLAKDLTAETIIEFNKDSEWDMKVYEAYKNKYYKGSKYTPKGTIIDFKDETHEMTITMGEVQ